MPRHSSVLLPALVLVVAAAPVWNQAIGRQEEHATARLGTCD